MKVYILLCLLLFEAPIISVCDDDVAAPAVQQAVAGDHVPVQCWNFTIGDRRRQTFTSPYHPHNYVNNTECIRLIIAPQGKRIQLDFRGEFDIEESEDCKYDFLEVKDGPFGYSPSLGKYCGKIHPPMKSSTSRFMWLRFKSDDSIEYQGFQAVFDFFTPSAEDERERKVCHIDVSLSANQQFLSSHEIPETVYDMANDTGMPIDCTWVIYAPADHRVSIKLLNYSMSTAFTCTDSFIQVYERTTAESDKVKQWCGVAAKEGHQSGSNHVYLRMFAAARNLVPLFKALVTVYLPVENKVCPPPLFNCGDRTCINQTLKCNGQTNCDRGLDEMYCEKGTAPPSTKAPPLMNQYHVIILGVVGGLLFTIICISVVVTCRQRQKEELRRRHALTQERRHNTEIEMTNLLNRSPHQNRSPHGHRAMNHVTTAVPAAAAATATGGAGATATKVGNHVSTNSNGNGPKAHTLPRRRDSRKGSCGHSVPGATGQTSEFDVSDLYALNNNDAVTFRRYLDVHNYNDDDSSPNPSTHLDIAALVTVERPPPSPLGLTASSSNPRTLSQPDPSPREVNLNSADRHQNPLHRTHLSSSLKGRHSSQPSKVSDDHSQNPADANTKTRYAGSKHPANPGDRERTTPETVSRSKSNPLELSSAESLPVPSSRLYSPPQAMPEQACREKAPSPRPDVIQEEKFVSPHADPDLRRLSIDTVRSDKSEVWKPMTAEMLQYSLQPPAPAQSRGRPPQQQHYNLPTQQNTLQLPQTSLQLPRPKPTHPAPIQPTVHNTLQPPGVSSHPRQSQQPKSPRPRGSKSPPKPPKRTTESLTPKYGVRSGAVDSTPDIFYTRPNRSVTRHHPV